MDHSTYSIERRKLLRAADWNRYVTRRGLNPEDGRRGIDANRRAMAELRTARRTTRRPAWQDVKERIEALGCTVTIGAASRCYMSISSYTPAVAGRLPQVDVNAEVTLPAAITEALAIQLALLLRSGGARNVRVMNVGDPRWLRKAWHCASVLLAPAREWDAAVSEGLSDAALMVRFGLTERMLRIRQNLAAGRRGNIGPILASDELYSLTYKAIVVPAASLAREAVA